MSKHDILVIEDEDDIVELVSFHLKREGYAVVAAMTGEEGLRAVRRALPALIVLDRMLPGIDGLEVCRQLQQDSVTRDIPIVMLTAKNEEIDIITGLEVGADDYITKPFSPKVLLARVRAILRRQGSTATESNATYRVANLTIDPVRYAVRMDDTPVELTLTEFRILDLLARHRGWVFSRVQIVDAARGEDVAATERSVDVHIVSLRKKLGDAGHFIETVRGVGYRCKE